MIFVAVEGPFVRFTKGHDHFISNSIRCGFLRQDQCNVACLENCSKQKCTGDWPSPLYRAHRGLGLDESEFTKSVLFFIFYFLGHITSVNNVVVTVLYLLRALHRRIIVYRIL